MVDARESLRAGRCQFAMSQACAAQSHAALAGSHFRATDEGVPSRITMLAVRAGALHHKVSEKCVRESVPGINGARRRRR